jgi:uncharacterized protein
MKIVVTGATGFIGRQLSELLIRGGHELILLTRMLRHTASRSKQVQYVIWNPADETSVVNEVDGADAVINLAGESIAAKRWSKKQKERLLTSRVNATQIVAKSIQRASQKPKILLSASAVGFYGPRGNESIYEDGKTGHGFLAQTCQAWEAHAIRVEDFGSRVVRLRIGVVLGRGGGALEKILPPFRMFAGGTLGNGHQWMSWVHLNDIVRAIEFCLTHQEVRGAINLTAPAPVTNKAFSIVLAQLLKRSCFALVPPIALKLLMGEMADELLLQGQRVIPKKLLDAGFVFHYPELRGALEHILREENESAVGGCLKIKSTH